MLFQWVPCGGGGPSASPPLLNDATASLRRGDSHPAHEDIHRHLVENLAQADAVAPPRD